MEPGFRRVLLSAAAIGVGVGLLASVFRELVEWLHLEIQSHIQLMPRSTSWLHSIVITVTLVAITLLLVRRVAPEAGGSGIQEIEGALGDSRRLRWRRLLPVKFFGGVFTLGSGMVVGREGPAVQMGGHVGAMVHELFRLPAEAAHALFAAGSAAGLSAAFNAPMSGVLFVIEEMRPRFRYGFLSVQAVLVASGCADVTSRIVTSQKPVMEFVKFPAPEISVLWIFPLFGALLGLVGVCFNGSLIGTLRHLDRFTPRRRLIAGLSIAALIGVGGWAWSDMTSGGYSAITDAVALRFAIGPLLFLFVLRFVATVISYGSGVPGGIFTPMLALGTLLGVSLGIAVDAAGTGAAIHPSVFAVVGMGALFASTVRAPLTGIALSIELTASYDLILPLLLACCASTIVAEVLGGRPIYELLLERSVEVAEAEGPVSEAELQTPEAERHDPEATTP